MEGGKRIKNGRDTGHGMEDYYTETGMEVGNGSQKMIKLDIGREKEIYYAMRPSNATYHIYY